MVKITYKHWKKEKTLEVTGVLPKELNNGSSERLIVLKEDGSFEDVLKNTVITIESISRM